MPSVDVAAIRASTGLSQGAFARSIGVAKGTLLNWEHGRRRPTGPAPGAARHDREEALAGERAAALGVLTFFGIEEASSAQAESRLRVRATWFSQTKGKLGTTLQVSRRHLAAVRRPGWSSSFDTLPAVTREAMFGRWRGAGLRTRHRLDGMLEAFGWYGKAFADCENVHPLLFRHGKGLIFVDPRWLPVALTGRLQLQHRPSAVAAFKVVKSIIATEKPTARLRQVSCRGVPTAALVYDRQPIIDFFRTVALGVVLGLMDFRGHATLFFTLRKGRRP